MLAQLSDASGEPIGPPPAHGPVPAINQKFLAAYERVLPMSRLRVELWMHEKNAKQKRRVARRNDLFRAFLDRLRLQVLRSGSRSCVLNSMTLLQLMEPSLSRGLSKVGTSELRSAVVHANTVLDAAEQSLTWFRQFLESSHSELAPIHAILAEWSRSVPTFLEGASLLEIYWLGRAKPMLGRVEPHQVAEHIGNIIYLRGQATWSLTDRAGNCFETNNTTFWTTSHFAAACKRVTTEAKPSWFTPGRRHIEMSLQAAFVSVVLPNLADRFTHGDLARACASTWAFDSSFAALSARITADVARYTERRGSASHPTQSRQARADSLATARVTCQSSGTEWTLGPSGFRLVRSAPSAPDPDWSSFDLSLCAHTTMQLTPVLE